ncbi:hypothetical protein F5Y14DRAFT_464961 [Nemania sp. NC0429]|nr:hypothetical protein F5Y14DRAFT_464961 [Nemania sp. NC0429]
MPDNLYKPSAYQPSQTARMFLDYENTPAAGTLLAAARKHNIAILNCISGINTEPPASHKVAATRDTKFKPTVAAILELGAEYGDFACTNESAKYL